MSDGATRRSKYLTVASMAMSQQNLDHARASPVSDARRPRPNDVVNGQGLPTHGRSGLKKRVHLRFGTINIGTMTGRSRELAAALKARRIDIACVQETKWAGAKAKDIGEGYKLYYNGERKNQNGVGIVISPKLQDSIVEVNRISDRLMSIKLDSGGSVLRVVTCYAPQTGCPDDVKDAFWDELEGHLRTVGPEEHLAIGGDMNGHVGSTRDGYEQHHGGQGYGTRNDDGGRVLDFAEAHDLAIANTYFKKKSSHLVTYASGGRETQIDYWLIRRRSLQHMTNAKVIPSDNIAPQHRLLVLDMHLDMGQHRCMQTTGPARTKWWRLSECKNQLKMALEDVHTNLEQPIDAAWNEVVDQLQAAAQTVLGQTKPGTRFIEKQIWWWNEEVQKIVKEKKMAFKKWRQTHAAEDLQTYRHHKSAAKRAVATAKATHYNQLYADLDTLEGVNKIYRLANLRHRSTQDIGQIKYIKNDNHQVLRDPPTILRRWSDYFSRISNQEFPHPPIVSADPVPGPVPRITTAEVTTALKQMKNGKAPGPDDLPAEAWKLFGQDGASFLADLFNRITITSEVPKTWLTSTTVPIWKGKGDVAECSNYRPIRLLCHAMKIFERVIDARIRQIVTITPNQCGFVKGCGTTDAIHAARLLLEKHREKNMAVHTAFLDLEKAFDRIPHDLIWSALRSHNIPEAYVQWIKLLYTNVTSRVRCAAGISPPFNIGVGVHQGSALSPLLFILCMDTATSDLQQPHPWSLLYADDVLLASEGREEVQRQTQRWKTRLDNFGMRINLKKTEYMQCGPQTDGTISIDNEQLKKATEFKYLGSVISHDGSISADVRARTNAAWLKWRQVTGVLCDRRMPDRLKGKIYKTVVRPVALYGSECWPTSTKHEQALHVMEMRMLRWCLGITRRDHIVNEDIRKRLGITPITEKMLEARLRWYGHVMRSNADSVAKRAMNINPVRQRPRGRPKKRWLDRINEDMKTVNATPNDALDRTKWRKLCQQADPAI